ncbi:MAG: segregation/condensation protein A [Bacillota bacterium]|nr:segregation/condensation protein A [Bacillota bacterium]
MSYRVKLNIFEGPFDLLVYLIEHARMSIYDIRVSEITTQYMAYIEQMQEADINPASEFMVLAAELLELKSKMLLPRKPVEEDSGAGYEDPRTELVEKLKEYKKYKAVSEMLRQRHSLAAASIEKPQEDLAEYTGEPDEYLLLDGESFKKAFEAFLRKKKKLEEIKAHHIRSEKQKVTTELRMSSIRSFFKERPIGRRVDFEELVEKKGDKYDIAVTFSSVLEMMKQRTVDAEQEKLFGNIQVYATEHLNDENTGETETNGEQNN